MLSPSQPPNRLLGKSASLRQRRETVRITLHVIRIAGCAAGAVVAALGTLWLLQGLGAVRLAPILCFADCAPVQGPSLVWAAAGAILIAAGGVAAALSLRRR